MTYLTIRPATPDDHDAIWVMLEPVFRAGETYAIDRDISRADALAYWTAEHTFIAEDAGRSVGTFYIRRNQKGGGSHVANAGYITARGAEGRGIARQMLTTSLDLARELGFAAMQFNLVVSTNTRAIATWEAAGFVEIGRVPLGFRQPNGSFTDALILHRFL